MKRFPLRRTALALALGVGAAVITPALAIGAPGPTPGPAPVEIAGKKPAQPVPVDKQAGLRAYFVITEPSQVAAGKTAVTSNGGTVYASYDAIGVIVAHSTDAEFAAKVRPAQGVQKVGATRTSDVPAAAANPAIPPSPSQTTPTAAETNRSDMTQIGADKAWDINPGSASVTVGVLDTGVDDQHYDLKPNFDAGKSASCAYGKLDTREGSWRPVGDHGTHVAGTIAAARNGKGMVGVAPGVKISSVRVAEAGTQLFFPENTVCAFVFAGDKGLQVTNNSYYTDPWLFACPTDNDQAAILEGVKRAVGYAEGKNVLNVAAAGNENYNLAKKTTDSTSPNDSTPVNRTVTDDCQSLPTELPGVVVVSSVNGSNVKSSFSNYGTDKVHVAAPGDNVYSTVLGGQYGAKSGTSMASPHVAGVAALLASVNPGITTTDLRAKLAAQANDIACPAGETRCTGSTAKNSFYGEGLVDAKESVEGPASPVSVTGPGDQSGKVGQAASLQIKATDAGGKALTYAASGLPAGLTINSASGLISGTPTAAGSSSVTVTVTNADGKTGTAKFGWTVTSDGGGGTVTVTKPSDQWGFVNWAVTPLQLSGSSTAGGALTYTAAGLPTGLTISPAGRVSGTPTKAGTYTVTVTGTDAGGAKGTTSFGWRIYGF